MNKLNNIHEKCLRLITNKYDSTFNKLQKACINYLTTEVCTFLLFWKIITIFKVLVYFALNIQGQYVSEWMQ